MSDVRGTAEFRAALRQMMRDSFTVMTNNNLPGNGLFKLQELPPPLKNFNPFSDPMYEEEAAELGLKFVLVGGALKDDFSPPIDIYACIINELRLSEITVLDFIRLITRINYLSASFVSFSGEAKS